MVTNDQTIFDDYEDEDICFKCNKDLENSPKFDEYKLCDNCDFHFHISARERISLIVDKGSFKEIFNKVTSSYEEISKDEILSYEKKIKIDQIRTGLNEAVLTGTWSIGEADCVLIALDFGFLGGSMGLVVKRYLYQLNWLLKEKFQW